MTCAQPAGMPGAYPMSASSETVFTVDPRPLRFGPGAALEVGIELNRLGIERPCVFIDPAIADSAHVAQTLAAIRAAGRPLNLFQGTAVEPTDTSFRAAAEALAAMDCDGIVSIGGGSVIDTAKAANLLVSHPADLLRYVNAPVGEGAPVPGRVLPHIALPTTAGTGSEATGVAVFDLEAQRIKTGISSAWLKPDVAIVDPLFTHSLPPLVTAATAFDVLTHAIESYTAMPYNQRERLPDPARRPPYQGANPSSDIGALEAIRLGGLYLRRAVDDGSDAEARLAMSWAATLAGSAFGNAGVHVPHAMSYSVAGMIGNYHPEGWPPEHALCPHGISVVINAPAAFRFTAPACPERHLHCAALLGADTSGAQADDAGAVLAEALAALMRATGVPNGLGALGYTEADIPALADGCWAQQRLLRQSPVPMTRELLPAIYRDAMRYWP